MICPHCNKEVDGYVGFSSETVKLVSFDNRTATNVIPTFVVNAVEAKPQDFTNTVVNHTASANVGANLHYHTF